MVDGKVRRTVVRWCLVWSVCAYDLCYAWVIRNTSFPPFTRCLCEPFQAQINGMVAENVNSSYAALISSSGSIKVSGLVADGIYGRSAIFMGGSGGLDLSNRFVLFEALVSRLQRIGHRQPRPQVFLNTSNWTPISPVSVCAWVARFPTASPTTAAFKRVALIF